ncbi:MAG: hypothetical protein LUQ40_02320 [Methanomicrobiales archaeon]|nr:hypothetical protein [Methanomicrobiales archaeon]
MKEVQGFRVGEMVMELVLINMAISLTGEERSEISPYHQRLLASYGVNVHQLTTSLTGCTKEGNKTVCEGTFLIDVDKQIEGVQKRMKSSGRFRGVIKDCGAMRIEYFGDNFTFKSEIAQIGTDGGNITYQVSEVTSG